MNSVPILTVESVFRVRDGSCILTPDFPIVENLSLPVSIEALLVKNSELTTRCILFLELTHVNVPTTTDMNRRWRITLKLSEIGGTEVDAGDVLHIFDKRIAEALTNSST